MNRKRHWQFSRPATIALLLLLGLESTAAQRSSVTCQAGWEWARTKLNDSPCQVASKLLSLCESSSSSDFTLQSDSVYTPSTSDNGPSSIKPNTCACNIVMYNLLSACQACQASSGSTPELIDWKTYAAACPICSFEGGIVPGPCGPMNSIGFPNSVNKPSGNNKIAIPNWAYYNSSGGAWSEDGARQSNNDNGGGDKLTISAAVPAAATPTSNSVQKNNDPSDKSSKDADKHGGGAPPPMTTGMKAAVISCSILAGIIAIVFGTYLFQLCLRQRHTKQLKKFSDETFEKVVPTALNKQQGHPQRSKLLAFKNVMSRLTLAPKTPFRSSTNMNLRSPGTPGGIPKTPKTPRTAFLKHFPFVPFSPERDTARADIPGPPTPLKEYGGTASARPGESKEKLLPPEGKLDRLLASAASSHTSIASSYYSDFDSYKPSTAARMARSNSINSATTSLETVKTGSVKAKKPIEGSSPQYLGVPSAGSSHASSVRLSSTPSIVISSSEVEGDESERPTKPKAVRVKSQVAQISRWSDSNGSGNGEAAHSWSRVPSMHSEERSSTSYTQSKRPNNQASSSGSTVTLHQGEFTDSPTTDLSETLMTPNQQRMMMQDDQDVHEPEEEESLDNQRVSQASATSNSSLTSILRRLDQLDFGDTASNPATPRKVRFSTKSSKSVRVPPSPNGSSVGFAM